MAAWCDAHQVTKEQLKYWLRKLKVVHSDADGPVTPSWVPLKVSDPIQSITVDFDRLPIETVTYELNESDQACSCCGGSLHEMSTETRSEIAIVPPQVKVIRHVRQVYSCRSCERNDIHTPIITAPMPKPVYPGSLASPSILAHVMCQKYVESLPLYRQEQHFARLGFTLSRQTMANWMIYGAEKWLTPVFSAMKEYLLKKDILHADETTLQVLHEPGKSAE